jgi:glycosyltransferase involved in cell wall biosynthesis
MKLGFLIYGSLDTLSGGYLYDRKLVEYLRAHGDGVEIISLPWRNYAAHLTDNLHFRLPPDLDLLIQDELNHPSLLSANRRPRDYPVISLVHHLRCYEQRPDWQNRFYRLVEKRYLESVDGFIFNSQTTKRAVNRLIESNKPGIVAHPPTDRFGKGIEKSEVIARTYENGPLRVLFLGNVIRRKGLQLLLEAIHLGQNVITPGRDILSCTVDIVGSLTTDRAYASAMEKKVTAYGLQSTINFHSVLDREELAARLRSAHVLVVPSSYEGFGIVYLEGMAFGLPAIGTTSGGAHELISEGKTGYLVPPDGVALLAKRLSMLEQDRELLARLSLNALERYRQQPAWEETAMKIRSFLYGYIEDTL